MPALKTYDVTVTYLRSLPPVVGPVVEIEVDGNRRWTTEQVITLRASSEAQAVEAATPYLRHFDHQPRPVHTITAEEALRWTVNGDVRDPRQEGEAMFSNGKTYATKREAREDARFASDVKDRVARPKEPRKPTGFTI